MHRRMHGETDGETEGQRERPRGRQIVRDTEIDTHAHKQTGDHRAERGRAEQSRAVGRCEAEQSST